MTRIGSKSGKTVDPSSASLKDLVHVLARQAAREWAERRLESDYQVPTLLLSEKKS